MKPVKLVLRCYGERKGDQWQAFCLDFTLAAQADSFDEAKFKLERMIEDYVVEALGEHKEHAQELLTRRAPFRYWAKFYAIRFLCRIGSVKREMCRLFNEPVPLTVRSSYNHG